MAFSGGAGRHELRAYINITYYSEHNKQWDHIIKYPFCKITNCANRRRLR